MNSLKEILPLFKSMKDIGTHKGLAKLGDVISNLVYSIALSRLDKRLNGKNVNRTILSIALKNAGLRDFAKNRADSHDLADTAESFIGYSFCQEIYNIEEFTEIVFQAMVNNPENQSETNIAIIGFTKLLQNIKEKIEINFI